MVGSRVGVSNSETHCDTKLRRTAVPRIRIIDDKTNQMFTGGREIWLRHRTRSGELRKTTQLEGKESISAACNQPISRCGIMVEGKVHNHLGDDTKYGEFSNRVAGPDSFKVRVRFVCRWIMANSTMPTSDPPKRTVSIFEYMLRGNKAVPY